VGTWLTVIQKGAGKLHFKNFLPKEAPE